MNVTTRILLTCTLAAAVPGQQQATTLAELAARASAVVVATAVAATDPSPEWRRLEFRTDDLLRGVLDDGFALLEPAGRCCGRALADLVPGQQCVLFLGRQGPTLHPLGGDRGLLAADPELVAHVRELCRGVDAPARLPSVLAAGLDGALPRIRADAILALAALPPDLLAAADGAARARVLAALRTGADLGPALLPALATAAVRVDAHAAAAELLQRYLVDDDAGSARALLPALRMVPATAITAELAATPPGDDRAAVRAADLLAALPDPAHAATLDRMLRQAKSPRVQLALTEALLANGTRADALRDRVPAVVVELAQRRRQARPQFRALVPDAEPSPTPPRSPR